MAVDDQLGPMAGKRVAEPGSVDQPFEMAPSAAGRRMVDCNNAKQAFLPAGVKQPCKPLHLRMAHNSGCHEWGGGRCARHADERDGFALAQERKGYFVHVVTPHVIPPVQMRVRGAHIGVVIARHEADVLG